MNNNNENNHIDDPAFIEGGPVIPPKRKISALAEHYCDELEIESPDVRRRIDVLIKIQDKCDELEEKFFKEIAAIEAKYQNLYQPWYSKRSKIVNGVTDAEGVANETAADTDKEKGVPDFWLNAMKNNRVLAKEIFEEDEGALKFLKDIKLTTIGKLEGFKLGFVFDSNPYFSNFVLTKSYHMTGEKKNPELEKTTGTKIKWYPEKSLTHRVFTTIAKDKTYTGTKQLQSFFKFFDPPNLPDEEEIDEDMAYEIQELEKQIDQDHKIGSTIRDEIIPRAVSWFTGDAKQEESEDSEAEEEYEEDEDDYSEEE